MAKNESFFNHEDGKTISEPEPLDKEMAANEVTGVWERQINKSIPENLLADIKKDFESSSGHEPNKEEWHFIMLKILEDISESLKKELGRNPTDKEFFEFLKIMEGIKKQEAMPKPGPIDKKMMAEEIGGIKQKRKEAGAGKSEFDAFAESEKIPSKQSDPTSASIEQMSEKLEAGLKELRAMIGMVIDEAETKSESPAWIKQGKNVIKAKVNESKKIVKNT
jgi:hypothetical protein